MESTRYFEEKVRVTIRDYKLIKKRDKVLVAVSGGKDSTTALYILAKLGYNVEGIIIDQLLGDYSRQNLGNIKKFCEEENIKLHVIHMRDEYGCSVCYMKSVLDSKGIVLNTCAICGVIRRNILNKKSRELKADKIATGHNLDDEVQTIFMNFIRGDIARCARLGPTAGIVKSRKFIPRIKPLYFCQEKEVEKYSRIHCFPVVYDPCPCSVDSTRSNVKNIINEWEGKHPGSKEEMMKGFLKIKPRLKYTHASGKISECETCGEPSSNKVCKTCNILETLQTTK
ncbi:MAG: TIGR00269 family protein [Candidatus Altiarchaeota archaeon]